MSINPLNILTLAKQYARHSELVGAINSIDKTIDALKEQVDLLTSIATDAGAYVPVPICQAKNDLSDLREAVSSMRAAAHKDATRCRDCISEIEDNRTGRDFAKLTPDQIIALIRGKHV